MSAPLLATKLHMPAPRPKSVRRGHLLARLGTELNHKLTLVSAPAGAGKTALVSAWLTELSAKVAWLSLEPEDGDLKRFLSYVAAALLSLDVTAGATLQAALSAQFFPSIEELLAPFVNDLNSLSEDVILALDDYHTLESVTVDDALTFLLEHAPPQLHLVILSREDPQLPLAKLRVKGQLNELRAADLRFNASEVAELLNGYMGLTLSAAAIEALAARTEGWAAGLQMAALTLQGQPDADARAAAFGGGHRFVLDYLLEEVLHRQGAARRDFLLKTAILERFSGALCEAVTGQTSGVQTLRILERDNLFLVPLDNESQWYRYHHLFAQVLRLHLGQDHSTAEVAELHRRASHWYEQNGFQPEAIRQAVSAQDFERAADLLEGVWDDMDRSLQGDTWLRWLEQLPSGLIAERPLLRRGRVWCLLNNGELERGEAELGELEAWLAEQPSELKASQPDLLKGLPASLAQAKAYLAQAAGDLETAVACTQRMLDLLPSGDRFGRGAATSILALSQWTLGNLEEAFESLNAATPLLAEHDDGLWGRVLPVFLGSIRFSQGRLSEALSFYQEAQAALTSGELELAAREVYTGLAALLFERGDTVGAKEKFEQATAMGDAASLPGSRHHYYLMAARLEFADGKLEKALACLREGERRYIRTPLPELRPLSAWRVRFQLKRNQLAEAERWAKKRGLTLTHKPTFATEFEHLTLVRLGLARLQAGQDGQIRELQNLLNRLYDAATDQGRILSLIEILVVQTLVAQAANDSAAAAAALGQALDLAAPEGYARVFLEEPALATLLTSAATRSGPGPEFAKRIMELRSAPSAPGSSKPAGLLEPLTERELEVLRLVAEGLTNQAIADKLYRALDTVKGHNRRIYGKLGVKTRTEAVAKARDLNLL